MTILIPVVLTGFIEAPNRANKPSPQSVVNIDEMIKLVSDLNQQKEHQKAIDTILQVVNRQKEDSILRTLLVQTFDLFLEEEIRLGQRAIKSDPRNISNYQRVAGALELVGDNFHAMEVLLTGIRYNQKTPDLWMRIARLELAANRSTEALDVFREVIRLDKTNSDAYNNAAYILAKSEACDANDLKQAEDFAKSACRLDPNNPEYIDTLAEIVFKKGDQKEARTLIKQAIKLAPDNDAYLNQLKKFSPKKAPLVGRSRP